MALTCVSVMTGDGKHQVLQLSLGWEHFSVFFRDGFQRRLSLSTFDVKKGTLSFIYLPYVCLFVYLCMWGKTPAGADSSLLGSPRRLNPGSESRWQPSPESWWQALLPTEPSG